MGNAGIVFKTGYMQGLHDRFQNCHPKDDEGRRKYFELMVKAAFYGADWPDDDHYSLLGFFTAHKRGYLGKELWEVWATLDHERVVVNHDTKTLAMSMAYAFVNNGEQFAPLLYKTDCFIHLFYDVGQLLLNFMRSGKIFLDSQAYLWLRERSKPGEITSVTPQNWDELVNITKIMGDDFLTTNINLRFLFKPTKTPEARVVDAEKFDAWLATIPPKSIEAREKLFIKEFGNAANYYLAFLSTKRGENKYRMKILKKLENKIISADLTLGTPLTITPKVHGRDLCKMLVFLNFAVKNPDLICGIPSEDEYKVCALDVLLNNNKLLYDEGLEARECLENKIKKLRSAA